MVQKNGPKPVFDGPRVVLTHHHLSTLFVAELVVRSVVKLLFDAKKLNGGGGRGGGGIAQWITLFTVLNPAAAGSNPGIPDNLLSMLPMFIDGAAALSISGQQRHNYVDYVD